MKFRLVITVAAIAALSLAAAGTAQARPLKHAKPAQVTGTRLATALLPLSDFWTGTVSGGGINSGSKLQSTKIIDHVPRMTCTNFENGEVYLSDFGDTAAAGLQFTNSNWYATYPDTVIVGYEEVLQFANTASAMTLYNQAYARYAACHTFTENQGKLYEQTLSVTRTTVSGDRAFVTHVRELENGLVVTLYRNSLYVLAGTDVYIFFNRSGNNDEPSPGLMGKMIQRVQALYPHGK
jgi:hypothetical protein